jgi:surface antigen
VKGACQSLYRPNARLGEAVRFMAVCLIAAAASACSLSYSIVTLDVEEPETTASIAPKAISPLSPDLTEEDWRRAKAALGVALDPQGAGTQVSWDNPDTSRKGAFTPSGAPFVKNDEICRSFSAHVSTHVSAQVSAPGSAPVRPPVSGDKQSALHGQPTLNGQSALHGTACRPSGGEWAITEIKPADAPPADGKPARATKKA